MAIPPDIFLSNQNGGSLRGIVLQERILPGRKSFLLHKSVAGGFSAIAVQFNRSIGVKFSTY